MVQDSSKANNVQLNEFLLSITQGDTITIESDVGKVRYEFVNQTDTGRIHLGLLSTEMDGKALEGERVSMGKAEFEQKIEEAGHVIVEHTEAKDLSTEQSKVFV